MEQISKWLIGIACTNYFWEGTTEEWVDTSPVFLQYEIDGLDFEMEKSDSQEFGPPEPSGPPNRCNNKQPSVSGSVSSTGGNITSVSGRYGSTLSSWTLATAVDGAFDSPYE